MDQIEKYNAVSRMQIYIADHLQDKISLKDLAQSAGYSPWHAERLFKELTGTTPFSYIRALRLTKAALSMRDRQPSQKIVDVALDFVFDSHEGFTRAFTRQFGLSPKRYQKNPEPLPLFMPHQVRDYYQYLHERSKTMSGNQTVKSVFVQVIERPERKAIIKRGMRATHYFEYCEEVGCDVWGILTSIKEALYEPAGFWLPEAWIKPGTSEYVQGVEVPVDYSGKIPEGFELVTLPSCKMMVFQGEAFEDEQFGDAIGEVWALIDRYDPKLYGFDWAPCEGPRFQLEPRGYRGYIEGRPVKTL